MSKNFKPLATNTLTWQEVLRFRDKAFIVECDRSSDNALSFYIHKDLFKDHDVEVFIDFLNSEHDMTSEYLNLKEMTVNYWTPFFPKHFDINQYYELEYSDDCDNLSELYGVYASIYTKLNLFINEVTEF